MVSSMVGNAGAVHAVVLLSRNVAGVEGVVVVSVRARDPLPVGGGKALVGGDADVGGIGVGGVVAAQLIVGHAVGVDEDEAVFRDGLGQGVHRDVLLQINVERSGGVPGRSRVPVCAAGSPD